MTRYCPLCNSPLRVVEHGTYCTNQACRYITLRSDLVIEALKTEETL